MFALYHVLQDALDNGGILFVDELNARLHPLLVRSFVITLLYSLADFADEDGTKIRKDESYGKNYLLGKYCAIPVLKSFDMFKEE